MPAASSNIRNRSETAREEFKYKEKHFEWFVAELGSAGMVIRGLWVCKIRLVKHFGLTPILCLLVVGCFFALIFIDYIELWVTSLRINGAGATHGGILAQSVPPTRPEEYLLMPSPLVCQRAKPYLITLVTSTPANSKARQAIRDTWGGEVQVQGYRVMTLFMVGQVLDPVVAKQLTDEAREHGDLVQGRFLDSYANLTLKTLSMLAWARRFCPEAPFLAKVDDDVMFNPSALLQYIKQNWGAPDGELAELYLGRVHLRVAPDRDPSSRHFFSKDAFSGTVFPDYCSGTAYVLSRPAVLKLSLAAAATPLPKPLPPEDVFVGLCAHTAGITPTHCSLFSGAAAVSYARCCYQAMVSVHHTKPDKMRLYWADMHDNAPCNWWGARTSLGICKLRAILGDLL